VRGGGDLRGGSNVIVEPDRVWVRGWSEMLAVAARERLPEGGQNKGAGAGMRKMVTVSRWWACDLVLVNGSPDRTRRIQAVAGAVGVTSP
jgi:hypothetical protein